MGEGGQGGRPTRTMNRGWPTRTTMNWDWICDGKDLGSGGRDAKRRRIVLSKDLVAEWISGEERKDIHNFFRGLARD